MASSGQETLRDHILTLIEGSSEVLYPIGDEPLEPRENDVRAELVHLFVRCRESIQGEHPSAQSFESFFEENREIVEAWIDNYYVYPQLHAITGMVERTVLLAKFETTSTPSTQTNLYISEATECYVHGHMLAAVVIARAALEQSLKERLNDDSYRDYNLGQLLKAAEQKGRILSPSSIQIARALNKKCNTVMHNRPIQSNDDAFHILDGVRILLGEIYTARDG
jgi:hypothetical protein